MKELIYMSHVLRWAVVAVLVGHGLIHFLGVVKGFGWADVAQLKQPIGAGGGVIWLLRRFSFLPPPRSLASEHLPGGG